MNEPLWLTIGIVVLIVGCAIGYMALKMELGGHAPKKRRHRYERKP